MKNTKIPTAIKAGILIIVAGLIVGLAYWLTQRDKADAKVVEKID